MKPLPIDFVDRRCWQLPLATRARAILIALAVAALLAGGALLWYALHLARELADSAQAITLARQQLVARTPPPLPPLRLAERQVLAINAAVAQLNTPWPALLDGFENVASADIALLQIEPDHRRRLVKGVAEARNHQAMLDYLAALGSSAPFARAMVTKQEINDKDPNRPLRFTFEALLGDPVAGPTSATAKDGQ